MRERVIDLAMQPKIIWKARTVEAQCEVDAGEPCAVLHTGRARVWPWSQFTMHNAKPGPSFTARGQARADGAYRPAATEKCAAVDCACHRANCDLSQGPVLGPRKPQGQGRARKRSCIPVAGASTSSSRRRAEGVHRLGDGSLGLSALGNPCRVHVGTRSQLHPHCQLRLQLCCELASSLVR